MADHLPFPYAILNTDEPLTPGNDLRLFRDDGGKTWAFFNRGQGIRHRLRRTEPEDGPLRSMRGRLPTCCTYP